METREKWPWALIFIYILAIGLPYIANFHSYRFSDSPSDWGAVGDYFGGLINPLSSLIALYFLIKAYLAQKEELRETRSALQSSAIHQAESAKAQKELTVLEAKRLEATERLLTAQTLSAEISSKHEEVRFLSVEVDRCTVAINSNRFVFDINGKKLHSDEEINNYRIGCLRKIDKAMEGVGELRVQLQSLHNDQGQAS